MRQFLMSALLLLLFVFLPMQISLEAESERKALVINVKDTIDTGLSFFIRRILKRAEKDDNCAGVILIINSTGGYVSNSLEIKDAILNSDITTIAFIQNRALSAAALIAISCSKIAMKDNSTIGAATPILLKGNNISDASKKMVSAYRAEFASSAEKRGRPKLICEAMVDNSLAVQGLVKPGELLTLTTEQANQVNLVDYNVNTLTEVMEEMGWGGVTAVPIEPSPGESFARIITNHNVSSVLLGMASLGIMAFFFTGSMMGLMTSLCCYGLVYGAYFFAGIANPYAFVFLAAGIIFAAAEIFVLPGFGIAGISGLVLIGMSLVLNFETPMLAFTAFMKGAFIMAIGGPVIWNLGGKQFFKSRFVLQSNMNAESGFEEAVTDEMFAHLIGEEGLAHSPLRPGGKIKIGNKRYDAVTDGDFIEKGKSIRVIDARANNIFVEELV